VLLLVLLSAAFPWQQRPSGAPLTCCRDKVVQLPTAVQLLGMSSQPHLLLTAGCPCGCSKPTHVVNIVAVHSAAARGLLICWVVYGMFLCTL